MSETIQRYYPLCGIHCEPCMGESSDGMYVDYADHLAALAAARAELAEAQANLAAVRKVEEWIQRGNDPLKPEHAIAGVVNRRYGAFVRCEAEETTVATGKSLIALGRALAAQEGA